MKPITYSNYQENRGRPAPLPTQLPGDERARRHTLVEEHAKLLQRLARRIIRKLPDHASEIETDDLVSSGIIGLFEADARYDPSTGKTFAQFAEFRIRGAMLDELRARDLLPRRLRARTNTFRKRQDELTLELGREPTDDELAAALGLDHAEYQELKVAAQPVQWVDAGSETVFIADERPDAFTLLAGAQERARVAKAIKSLPQRQQIILDLYFVKELTMREIANVLDLTVGRISQLKSAAVKALRELVTDQDDYCPAASA